MASTENFRVLIAGGGVAALEATLALREIAGERVSVTLLAPDEEFKYRPLRVREPFSQPVAPSYPLDRIARDLDAELIQDRFKWLYPREVPGESDDTQRHGSAGTVHTETGAQLPYDALLLALGAGQYPAFRHALTLDDRRLDEQMHGLICDVEEGYVHRLVFVIPSRVPWPLPVYELALMTARRAYDMNIELSITVATPEDSPLAVFGSTVSDAVGRVLEHHRIETITSAHCTVPGPGRVTINPGDRTLLADRIVALPELVGPSTPGVPKGSPGGFIPVDMHCKVRGLDAVYAAGDATDFPIKHGGIAAQQADTAAAAIAALAGAPVEPQRFSPTIHGVLLGAEQPLYMSAHVTGGHGSSSEIHEDPDFLPTDKIEAKYLTPYLELLSGSTQREANR